MANRRSGAAQVPGDDPFGFGGTADISSDDGGRDFFAEPPPVAVFDIVVPPAVPPRPSGSDNGAVPGRYRDEPAPLVPSAAPANPSTESPPQNKNDDLIGPFRRRPNRRVPITARIRTKAALQSTEIFKLTTAMPAAIGVIIVVVLAYLHIDADSGKQETPLGLVIAHVAVGESPNEVAVDPATHTVYVANNNGETSLSVIDPANYTVTASIAAGRGAKSVAVDASTREVYVPNDVDKTLAIVDPTTHAVTAIPLGGSPHGIAVDPANHTAYVTNTDTNAVSIVDTTSKTVTASIPVGRYPVQPAVVLDTHDVYITNMLSDTVSILNPGTQAVSESDPVGAGGRPIAVDAASRLAYVATDKGVLQIDPVSHAVTPISEVTGDHIAIDPTSHIIYMSDNLHSAITVLDPATRAVVTTFAFPNPNGIAVDPARQLLYVTSVKDHTLTVLPTKKNNHA